MVTIMLLVMQALLTLAMHCHLYYHEIVVCVVRPCVVCGTLIGAHLLYSLCIQTVV
jgi:hypothetical protein